MAGTSIRAIDFKLSIPSSHFLLRSNSNSHLLKINPQLRRNSSYSIPNPSLNLRSKSKFNASPVRASASSSNSANDGEGGESRVSSSGDALKAVQPLLNFAANNFLLLALIGGVALGFVNPTLGCLADKFYLSKLSTFCVFIISGLTLQSKEIGEAAEAWPTGLYGLVSILLLTPVFARLILQLNIQPPEFVTGLALFCCMPTTLSSGVSLTRLVGGNFALALAMTVISNVFGILVIPFSISKFVASGVGICFPTKQLFKSLVITLLIPLILGKILRESIKGVADFADKNRRLLSCMIALLLSIAPWIQVSKSRSLLLMVSPTSFILAIGLGVLLHLILLAFNAVALKILASLPGGSRSAFADWKNTIAILLVASQKTVTVMVAVVDQLGGAFGASGLLVLPAVAAHLNQTILDSFLVNALLRKEDSVRGAKIA